MADHTKQQKSGKRSIHPRTHARSAISTAGHRASATYHLLSREEKNNQSQPSATATLQLEVFPQQIIQQQELRVDTASTLPCTRVGTLVLNFARPPATACPAVVGEEASARIDALGGALRDGRGGLEQTQSHADNHVRGVFVLPRLTPTIFALVVPIPSPNCSLGPWPQGCWSSPGFNAISGRKRYTKTNQAE